MLSNTEAAAIEANSDQKNLLHLIEKVCPREVELDEPMAAYQAFCDWVVSGCGLGIKELVTRYQQQPDPPTTELSVLEGWVEEFSWRSRLTAWKPIHQAYQRQLQQQREIQILQRWNDRRLHLLECADKLLAKAELMLKHPHIQKVIYNEVISEYPGQIIPTTTVIMPVKWQAGDIASYQKTAMALLQEVVGDRQIMIDRLTADGFVITDPSSNDDNIHSYLEAIERLEALQQEIL
jgi:hypothetical protein